MTNPGPGGQWPQQGDPWQGGYQQGGYQQPTGPNPMMHGQQYPQQPPYQGQPQYGAPQQLPYGPGMAGPPAPRKSRRGLVIGLVVALVALVAGGGTWFAVSQTDSVASGAGTPAEAAEKLARSLGNGDVVGLLSTLAPAEAALFTDPLEEATAELKRLGILDPAADPSQLTGLQLETADLVFDPAQEERVNDHLAITKLTGGTLTVTADLSTIPLSENFLDAALSESEQADLGQGPQTETVDIADFVRRSGQPIRIATVQVDGQWYPSLLYTMADYVLLDEGVPWPAESIPANGAASPNEAVQQMLQAGLNADVRRMIELLPPDAMGVLHDAGPAILDAIGTELEPTGVTVNRVETETSDVAGGTRATITALEMAKDGDTMSLTKSGDCYEFDIDSAARSVSQRLCAEELARIVQEEADSELPPEVRQVLLSLGTGLLQQGLGIVTTEVNGKHYVSPLRTVNELGMTVLRSLEPADLEAMLRLAD